MSLDTMIGRMEGEIPGIAATLARNQINEALGYIYDEIMWSFQLKVDGWFTPGLLFPNSSYGQSAGFITVNTFDTFVTGDATASAAWLSLSGRPLITELQIRSPFYSLYNIISIDPTNPAAVILNLDRPWMEPSLANGAYMLYQAYFPVPVPDFKRFFAVRDTSNAFPLNFWLYSQKDLAREDAQRTNFDDPCYVVPYQVDARPGSATLGNMLYELWPHPLSKLPYTFNYLRRGPILAARTDTVPYPLDEESVLWRAKEVAYLWKEAQKGTDVARGSGADYKFLAQAAEDKYQQKIKKIKDRDRDLVELYFNRYRRDETVNYGEPYANIQGNLNVGEF